MQHRYRSPHVMLFAAVTFSLTFVVPDISAQQFQTTGNTNLSSNLGSVYVGGSNNLIEGSALNSFLGGGAGNTIESGVWWPVLAGGRLNLIQQAASHALIGGGYGNAIRSNSLYGFLGGGALNEIGPSTTAAAVVAGYSNTANANFSLILGGSFNQIAAGSTGSYIGGGAYNVVDSNAVSAAIVSGHYNRATASYAIVVGGLENMALGNSSTVPGGRANLASGRFSFAAGRQAKATNNGSFVWADDQPADFASTANNQFLIRATGGVGINTNNPQGNALAVKGDVFIDGRLISGSSNAATGTFAVVSGGTDNVASGAGATVAGGEFNSAGNSNAVVGGGYDNTASARSSTVAGGEANRAGSLGATIGGGFYNTNTAQVATISGGDRNTATGQGSSIGGGFYNTTAGHASAVAGGERNNAAGSHAAIPGGISNVASGRGSFAAGTRAKATNDYSFVWGGSPDVDTASSGPGTFTVRSPGGARFLTSTNNSFGVQLSANGAGWSSISDSNAKTAVTQIDHRETLAKLESMPVTSWRYKHDPDRRYIGPMAQDFHAAFGLGNDTKTISTLDTDGVALSAIKGLAEELRTQDEILAAREARIQALEKQVELLHTQLGL